MMRKGWRYVLLLALAMAPGATHAADPAAKSTPAVDWAAMPIDELRSHANANELPAMEEIGRRLIQGTSAPKDPQAGAGWLLRAAQLGSAQAAFSVGVMYERGFVVERDSTRAVEWYRKAADGNVPSAKHNLALLLRDGKGAPRDVKAALELLRSAAYQGMVASMFVLGEIYERGDGGAKDAPSAMAWFAITAEFDRQANNGESALAKVADARAQALRRTLTSAELAQAQDMAQEEFKRIVDTLSPAKPRRVEQAAAPSHPAPPPPPTDDEAIGWPKTAPEQIRAVQQALVDLRLLREQPDGVLGPMTRTAIRAFQRTAGLRDSGEPSRELYVALKLAGRDVVDNSPLPAPPRVEAKPEPTPAAPPPAQAAPLMAKADPVPIDLGTPEPPPPPPISRDLAAATPKADPPKPPTPAIDTTPRPPVQIKLAKPDLPTPPTSADVLRADPNAWPADRTDQIKVVQGLLRELRFYNGATDGQNGPETRAAIRDYQRSAGFQETGEPSRALFESLRELKALTAPKAN